MASDRKTRFPGGIELDHDELIINRNGEKISLGEDHIALKADFANQKDQQKTEKVNVKFPPIPLVALKGDGVDESAKAQALIDWVIANGCHTIYFPAGTYNIKNVKVNNNANPSGNIVNGITLIGDVSHHGYNTKNAMVSKLVCDTLTDTDYILNLDYCKNITVKYLGVGGKTEVADGAKGTGIGITMINSSFVLIEKNSFDSLLKGINMEYTAIPKIKDNNFSSCNLGAYISQCGDGVFGDNYINTNYKNYVNTNSDNIDMVNSSGILMSVCGSWNIYGGKIEWNRKGITLIGCNGINISGINFDNNVDAHIALRQSFDNISNTFAVNSDCCKSINIIGNRFLGGASWGALSNIMMKGHITLRSVSYVNISGNTFAEGDVGGYDNNLGTNENPLAFVRVYESYSVGITNNTFNSNTIPPCHIYNTRVNKSMVLFGNNTTEVAPTSGISKDWLYYTRNNLGKKVSYSSAVPADYGTFDLLDLIYNSATGNTGWRCATAGTFGTLTGYTGTVDSVNKKKITLNILDHTLYPGDYITIAGVTGVKKIVSIVNLVSAPTVKYILVDSDCDVIVTDAAISFSAPAFTTF